MSLVDLYNYKDAYKIYKIISDKNHPNIILNGKIIKKEFIITILNEYFFKKNIQNSIYDEEIYYEYNDIYYYFDIKRIKLDIKNTFINTIKKITASYNYFTNKNNYIILDNYNFINPILENKLKVIIEKSCYTTKFIILTSQYDKILEAIKSRCICTRIAVLNYYDKSYILKEYSNLKNFKQILEKYDDIELIKNLFNGYKDPLDIFVKKCIKLFNKKMNKNINDLKELSYNIKNSVLNYPELQKRLIKYYLQTNISNEKKSKIINASSDNNYLMINCYKDIIYIEHYLLEIYNIIND